MPCFALPQSLGVRACCWHLKGPVIFSGPGTAGTQLADVIRDTERHTDPGGLIWREKQLAV